MSCCLIFSEKLNYLVTTWWPGDPFSSSKISHNYLPPVMLSKCHVVTFFQRSEMTWWHMVTWWHLQFFKNKSLLPSSRVVDTMSCRQHDNLVTPSVLQNKSLLPSSRVVVKMSCCHIFSEKLNYLVTWWPGDPISSSKIMNFIS